MKLQSVRRWTHLHPHDQDYLTAVWPEAAIRLRHGASIPPMQDDLILDRLGNLPDWILDKYEVLNRLRNHPNSGLVLDSSAASHRIPKDGVIKPRYNAAGLARGLELYRAGDGIPKPCLWQERFDGQHFSADFVVNGADDMEMCAVAEGIPLPHDGGRLGQFAAWRVHPGGFNILVLDLSRKLTLAAGQALRDLDLPEYRGFLNLEAVWDGVQFWIVELHFRPSLEFGPLYGRDLRSWMLEFWEWVKRPMPPAVGGVCIPQPKSWSGFEVRDPVDDESWRDRVVYHCGAVR